MPRDQCLIIPRYFPADPPPRLRVACSCKPCDRARPFVSVISGTDTTNGTVIASRDDFGSSVEGRRTQRTLEIRRTMWRPSAPVNRNWDQPDSSTFEMHSRPRTRRIPQPSLSLTSLEMSRFRRWPLEMVAEPIDPPPLLRERPNGKLQSFDRELSFRGKISSRSFAPDCLITFAHEIVEGIVTAIFSDQDACRWSEKNCLSGWTDDAARRGLFNLGKVSDTALLTLLDSTICITGRPVFVHFSAR